MDHSDTVTRSLRDAGLRVTRPRLAVLSALEHRPHATADDVSRTLRDHPATAEVSVQAVYDVLAALHRVGLVRRFQPAGSSARYELRVGDNHHHLVCRSCGAVADVDCATGEVPCLDAGETAEVAGFVVDEAEVTYWGLCLRCAGPSAAATQR
ncbi:transcriptional repressor [Nocardioidaceae bacterium]|nr:transcriptional repressor [Nocardioidaceae bacterium]